MVVPEEIPKELLSDFQFCKVALEKIVIDKFVEEQQREMNLQAVEIYLHASNWICLKYDIDEIVKLVPENVLGNLGLYESEIKELPQLKSVGLSLHLENSQIRDLPQLESVGDFLNLHNSQIKELPKLESAGKKIFVDRGDLQYWKGYFTKANRPHLADKVVAS
jgi:hypothetical protein